jgi:hypothetical protein
VVWALVSVLGMLLLVLPGMYVLLGGMFAPLIVAVSPARGWSAVRESIRVVRAAGWWRTLGASFVVSLVAIAVIALPVGFVGLVVGSTDSMVVIVLGGIVEGVLQAALLSWSALATTLLYFSWKAGAGEPWQRPAGSQPVEIAGGGGPAPEPGAASAAQDGSPVQQWGASASGPTFVRPGQPRHHTPPPPDCPNDPA